MGRRWRSLVAVGTLAILSSCRNSTGIDVPTGRLTLASYDGASLPAVIGQLPTVGLDGSISHCNVNVAFGSLELNGDGHFLVDYQTENSCTGNGLGAPTDSGAYTLANDSLTFRDRASNFVAWGRLLATGVVLHYSSDSLEFKR
jgi:hypothetical protein